MKLPRLISIGVMLSLRALADDSAIATKAALAQRLVAAYPNAIARFEAPDTLVWKDGTRMPFGDARPGLSYEDRLADASLWDQLAMAYPTQWPTQAPAENFDPGRMRYEPFFRKLYGNSAAEVERRLTRVPWPLARPGRTVRFMSTHGAANALEAVGAELMTLPEQAQEYVARPNGTFNWRVIAGTDRLSMHSFGIAIDFEVPQLAQQYWKWDGKPGASAPKYPADILQDESIRQVVEVFERHNFIWGGKWWHYDLMHFEYRPEVLSPARATRPETMQ